MVEDDVVNGYAIYGEGTDYLYIANNLMGKCRGAGYFAKPVSFRMSEMERGGTSRDARLFNNIFYKCQKAAITMPTKDNEAEGNLYVKQTGGYLRVMYPAPQVCLDLPAWKKFYGFDARGQEGWFEIDVDTENYTLQFKTAKDRPFFFANQSEKRNLVYDPSEVEEVPSDSLASSDFFGNNVNKNMRVPGPFMELNTEKTYNIDPRKLK